MRLSVSLDDRTAEAVRVAAGGTGSMSGWVAAVVREKLMADSCGEASRYDEALDDEAWERARLEGRA